jgi:putative PIN family toxin of toxin-antitoxin system
VVRVLLDTNQLVSSLLSARGLQRGLIDAWRRRDFILMLAPGQIEEVGEVLSRPKIAKKYAISAEDREMFLNLLRSDAIPLPSMPRPHICRDPDDDFLLGCAAAGGVDYLISGDQDLLSLGSFQGVVLLTAREYLSLPPPLG